MQKTAKMSPKMALDTNDYVHLFGAMSMLATAI
jgi:bacteriorhodopsin